MNHLKTFVLLAALTALFVGLGYLLGGPTGMLIALVVAGGMNLVSYWNADKIVLKMYRAKEVGPEHRLSVITRRLATQASLPMPKVYVIPDMSPNAFATGRNPSHAAVAATEGVLRLLDDQELEGVIAHELSHIKNYDILVSTLVVTMVGIIAIVTDVGVNMMFWSSRSNRKSNDNAGIASILALVGFVFLIFAPLIARVLQASVSRQRETLADISGVELTRFPPGLISALEKLRDDNTEVGSISHATAHLWIEQPQAIETSLGRKGKVNRMFDTHPPIEERIALLREL